MERPKITLCMIVKDETHVIEDCLKSMAPYIDRYDITDTGSTDGTPELIKKTMDELGIPGEVYLSDWKGFGDHANRIGSRTEAFYNAEKSDAEYAWVIDADDYIEGDFQFPKNMTADGYTLFIKRGEFSWWRNQIFKLDLGWRYVGILHEYADATKKKEGLAFQKIGGNYHVNARTEGNRNVGVSPIEKYTRDAEILEGALEDDPENSRYQFYLAQSYFDSQQWGKAKEAYKKRVEMEGWNEEVFYSQYRVALCCGLEKEPFDTIVGEFIKAYNTRPIRAEPLVEISRMYRMNDMAAAAYPFAKVAAELPYPAQDILFISEDVYRFTALDELGAVAFYAGKAEDGYEACKKLVNEKRVPDEHNDRVKENLAQYENVMAQMEQARVTANMEAQIEKLKAKAEANSNKESSNPTKYKKRKKAKSR